MDAEAYRNLVRQYQGRIVDSKYEVLAGLGHGNFGAVFLAFELLKKRFVAIKRVVVSRTDLAMVTAEIEGLEVLGGTPNVVQYLGYAIEDPLIADAGSSFTTDDLYIYIVMEFGGASLEKYLQCHGAESYREKKDEVFFRRNEMLCIHILKEALAGLRESHERRIVHRDIKPANIYLGLEGFIRLGDYGVAKQLMQEGPSQGTIVGTAVYMAPEQISGEAYSVNIDLFSMGVVLYRMLTGKMPFGNMMQIIQKDPDFAVQGIFPGMDEILQKALEKNPDRRYYGAQEMINDLEDYEVGLAPVGLGELLQQFSSRIRSLVSEDVLNHLDNPPSGEMTSRSFTAAPVDPRDLPDDQATRIGPVVTPEPGPSSAGTMLPVKKSKPPASVLPEPDKKPASERKESPAQAPPSPPISQAPPEDEPQAFQAPDQAKKSSWVIPITIVVVLAVVTAMFLAIAYWPRTLPLRIYCDQPATVFLDDLEVGRIPRDGPFEIKVAGDQDHRVRLAHDGFVEVDTVVKAGSDILDVTMAAEVKPPVLQISLNFRDVVLRAGGRVVTGSPQEQDGRFIWEVDWLPAGDCEIEASLPGSDFLPAAAKTILVEGEVREVKLDLVPGQVDELILQVLQPSGQKVDVYQLTINDEPIRAGAGGKVPGDYQPGAKIQMQVQAEGFKRWGKEVVVQEGETLVTAYLTKASSTADPGNTATPVPAGSVRVTSNVSGEVFVNWKSCGNTPAVCELPQGKAVEIFVFNYQKGMAWHQKYAAGKTPSNVYAKLVDCRKNMVIDWKPWAYIEVSEHSGDKIKLPVSDVESKPQTPKRIANLSCGCYKVIFSDAKGPITAKWKWVLPDDPDTVKVGKF